MRLNLQISEVNAAPHPVTVLALSGVPHLAPRLSLSAMQTGELIRDIASFRRGDSPIRDALRR
jgi:hypothetical protein